MIRRTIVVAAIVLATAGHTTGQNAKSLRVYFAGIGTGSFDGTDQPLRRERQTNQQGPPPPLAAPPRVTQLGGRATPYAVLHEAPMPCSFMTLFRCNDATPRSRPGRDNSREAG